MTSAAVGLGCALLSVGALLSPALALPERVHVGPATIFDGDTIMVEGVRFRLEGIHAPERGEPGARAATRHLAALVAGRTIRCVPTGARSYDRLVAVCHVRGLGDVGAHLVAAGVARDCERYSAGRYRPLETKAAQNLPLPRYCR